MATHGNDNRSLLGELLQAFDAMEGAQKKALTLAIGVDAARFQDWRKALAEEGPVYLNQTTRDSIASLLNPEGDARAEGIAWSLHRMSATVGDLEVALEMRRKLREAVIRRRSPHEGEVVSEEEDLGGEGGEAGQQAG